MNFSKNFIPISFIGDFFLFLTLPSASKMFRRELITADFAIGKIYRFSQTVPRFFYVGKLHFPYLASLPGGVKTRDQIWDGGEVQSNLRPSYRGTFHYLSRLTARPVKQVALAGSTQWEIFRVIFSVIDILVLCNHLAVLFGNWLARWTYRIISIG